MSQTPDKRAGQIGYWPVCPTLWPPSQSMPVVQECPNRRSYPVLPPVGICAGRRRSLAGSQRAAMGATRSRAGCLLPTDDAVDEFRPQQRRHPGPGYHDEGCPMGVEIAGKTRAFQLRYGRRRPAIGDFACISTARRGWGRPAPTMTREQQTPLCQRQPGNCPRLDTVTSADVLRS
jgi:hypothetical protein